RAPRGAHPRRIDVPAVVARRIRRPHRSRRGPAQARRGLSGVGDAMRMLTHQVKLEQRAFWRNPEAAFFTFALPIGLLLIFGATSSSDHIPGRPELPALTLFVPGILAFGLIVAAYSTLAATISTLRAEGVLKRVRATPLPLGTYLAGQLVSVVLTSLLIAVTTVALGRLVFAIEPRVDRIWLLLVALTLGIVCFAALGVAISGAIRRPESAGAITNG